MAKRANGEGTIRQRANGRWEARITYTDTETGRVERVSLYGTTAKAVRAKMKAARERLETGAPVKDASRSVGDWLAQWRETTLAASDRKESTRALYANLSRRHLEPMPFGAITLDKLRPSDVEALVLSMRAKTKSGATEDAELVRALADSTIRQTYIVLRAALDAAVRDGLLARNPAAQVRRPSVERREAKHLDASGVSLVLKAAAESRYHAALVLIASTGLRKGEALALRWDKVDLDAGVLRVAATIGRVAGRLVISEPKTARSHGQCRYPPRCSRCCASTKRPRPPSGCARRTNGRTQAWCSQPSSAVRSIRATCSACLRWPPRRLALRGSACTRCGTPQRWRGLSRACTSRPCLTCSGIRRSRSPATFTATPATTRPALRSTAWRDSSGYEHERTRANTVWLGYRLGYQPILGHWPRGKTPLT